MSNEWEKMLNGEPYDAANTEFIDRLFKTKDIIWEYNWRGLGSHSRHPRGFHCRRKSLSCGENHCLFGKRSP